jgi:predicted RNA-binding protein with PUA-like domain
MRHWLVKSEPDVFSIDHLAAAPGQRTGWDGVRNYQARNTLRDLMQVGDGVLFYHSSCEETGVVGLCVVVRAGHPDPTAFDARDPHFDPKSDPAEPTWFQVEIQLHRRLLRRVSLDEMKANPALSGMELLRRGSRLSVQPVTPEHWAEIVRMSDGAVGGDGSAG